MDSFITAGFIVSIILPIGFVLCICIKHEPTHILILEWLEIDLTLCFKYTPLLVTLMLMALGAGSLVYFACSLPLIFIQVLEKGMYMLTPTTSRMSILRDSIYENKHYMHYQFSTPIFENIEEEQVIHLFRSMQIFGVLMNNIYASMFVAEHQLGFLCIYVGLLYTIVRVPDVLLDGGFTFAGTILIALALILCIQFVACNKLGNQITISENFLVKNGKWITKRKSMYYKFLVSCRYIQLQVSHPFYSMDNKTFPDFIVRGIDFVITLCAI